MNEVPAGIRCLLWFVAEAIQAHRATTRVTGKDGIAGRPLKHVEVGEPRIARGVGYLAALRNCRKGVLVTGK